MRIMTILFTVAVLLLVGCSSTSYVCEDGKRVAAPEDCKEAAAPSTDSLPGETTTKEPIEPKKDQGKTCLGLTYGAGLAIAAEKCEGNALPDTAMCNENTRTFWVDLDLEKEGCSPACVVNVDDRKAEVNWRCTGLVLPEAKNIPADIQELLDAAKKVKSYSYQHYGPKPFDEIVNVFVMGDKIKLVYRVPISYNNLQFDTVYLNEASGNGVGYCEDIERGPCVNPNYEFSAPYVDFQHKLPLDWVDEIVVAEEVSSEFIGNRNALKLDVMTTAGDGFLWIDDYYGMPVRADIAGVEWEYRNMVFNSVTDEELSHKYITPRPVGDDE